MSSDSTPNWQALTENMCDGLVVVDQNGVIRFCNRAAADLLQRSNEELIGHPFGFPATTRDSAPVTLLTRDGQMLSAQMRSAEIEWESAPGCLVVIHDVTELVTKKREVEERNQKLSAQVADLEQFSFMVAHDLRAPLRAICSFAQILADDHRASLTPSALLLVQQIEERCDTMEELIDGLLALARSSIQPLKMVEVELKPLIHEIVGSMVEATPAFDGIVQVHDLPPVSGDPQLLRQVFTNLLSNSLKYSANARQPAVRVSCTPLGDAYRISVADNGIGFTERDAERVFDPFTRLDPKHRDGTGVGLAIVRNIVLRHGGRVWAEGVKGQGATFHIELPANAG